MLNNEYYEYINGTYLYFNVFQVHKNQPFMLFLNGGPGDSSIYFRLYMEKMGWNQNIIYLDQRACGKSSRNVEKDSFMFENLALDIE